MKKRLTFYGQTNDDRLNNAKLKSMLAATQNSYQAENITFNGQSCRCLINQKNNTEDFDQKMISIDFKYGLNVGDVFYWDRDDSHWITYLKERTEEAYFRAQIRKCNYEVEVGANKYWVYLRGPNEETLDWEQDHNINYNELNYSLVMYIQKNEDTLALLDRFYRIRINGDNYQVAATDKFSMDAIIQVYLAEDFNNSLEYEKAQEDQKKKEQKDKAAEEAKIYPTSLTIGIEGPDTVTAYQEGIVYTATNLDTTKTYTWQTSSDKAKIVKELNNQITIDILFKKANTFSILLYENGVKIKDKSVIVKSI